MAIVINFILANLVYILIGIVIILLAIIGMYADKTNFGEGKKVVKVKKKNNKKDIIDEIEVTKDENKEEIIPQEAKAVVDDGLAFEIDTNEENKKEHEEPKEDNKELTESEFLESNDLDELLPEKEVLDDDILQDLEDIDLDFKFDEPKFSKPVFESQSISDLGNIDLSDITKPKKKSTNLWK